MPAPLTIGQAAELANVSKSHIYGLVQEGVVPALRIGTIGSHGRGPIRIERKVFVAWLLSTPQWGAT
jgi:excisionase family DNA binding protein